MCASFSRKAEMEKFRKIDAPAVPLAAPNVDTDQIVPARFLRKPRRLGYGGLLFPDPRFPDDGPEKPQFILNQPAYRAAGVLVGERNFGCGSSREHAVYALWDYGFRAVIAPSFGDIFFNNCFKNGLLPIVLSTHEVDRLFHETAAVPGFKLTMDLERQTVASPDGAHVFSFEVEPFRKHCLLNGLD